MKLLFQVASSSDSVSGITMKRLWFLYFPLEVSGWPRQQGGLFKSGTCSVHTLTWGGRAWGGPSHAWDVSRALHGADLPLREGVAAKVEDDLMKRVLAAFLPPLPPPPLAPWEISTQTEAHRFQA